MRRIVIAVFGFVSACMPNPERGTTDESVTGDALSRIHRHQPGGDSAAFRQAVAQAEACIRQCVDTHRSSMTSVRELINCVDVCVDEFEHTIDALQHEDAGAEDAGAHDAGDRIHDAAQEQPDAAPIAPDAGVSNGADADVAPDAPAPAPDADVAPDAAEAAPDADVAPDASAPASDADLTPDAVPPAPDAQVTAPDADAPLPDAAPVLLPFGSACTINSQCESNLCFDFQARGEFCTDMCMNGVCPDPSSSGCNGMGVCKVP
jgi:hypothetical protein